MKKITLLAMALLFATVLTGQVTTGEVSLSSDYTARIDVDDTNVTVTMIGPDDRWLGLGFGVSSMTNNGDIISFDSTGFNDRRFIGVGATPPTDTQDWTVLSNTTAAGERTLIVTRPLEGSDTTDYTFDPSDSSILLVWARGNGTLNFVNHGSGNRGATSAGFSLSVDDLAFEQSISVYPNPTTSQITVDFDVPTTSAQITLYSVLGQPVHTQILAANERTINLEDLAAGVYVMQITSERGSASKRIIKQ